MGIDDIINEANEKKKLAEIEWANKRWLFDRTEDIESAKANLIVPYAYYCYYRESAFGSTFDSMFDGLVELIKAYLNSNPLYFTMGKYKGRIVQDIWDKDRPYCIWFKNNIIGKDTDTLKAIDFMHKQEIGTDYWLADPKDYFERVLKDFPNFKLTEECKAEILEGFISDSQRNSNFDCCLNDVPCDDSEGNWNNYYGDDILGEEDLV